MSNPVSYLYRQLQSCLRAAWSRRWQGLIVVWVVCVGGWLGVAQIPDWYTASTRIYIDTQSLLQPLLKNIADDQKSIWTSPFHLRLRDANWLVPLAGLAAETGVVMLL